MLAIDKPIDPAERGKLAEEWFRKGYNCCQSVVLAFSDIITASYPGLDESTIASLSSGFGGGFGRLREVCGAVSGMTFMAGIISPASDPSNHEARTRNYSLVQEFAAQYREENGSIICRELLGLQNAPVKIQGSSNAKLSNIESPAPSVRSQEYYKKRPCAQLVRMAAEIVARKLTEALS